jgi:hypothetical protein
MMSIADIESRGYMMEALVDIEPLRVLAWPRSSGKTAFMGYEIGMICHIPDVHVIIIHPSWGEAEAFESLYLQGIHSDVFTNITYAQIKEDVDKIIDRLGNVQLHIFFSEVDYFDMVQPQEVPVYCGRLLASLLLLDTVRVSQVTYVGTVWEPGSYLAKICAIPDLVHSVHPREVWPNTWRSRALSLKPLLSDTQFKSHVLGNF